MTNPYEVNNFLRSLQEESVGDARNEPDQGLNIPLIVDDEEHAKRVRSVGLFTTHDCVVPGWRIVRTLPMISSRRVLGINAWQDMIIAVRDLLGGRSQTAEKALATLEAELLQELQQNALSRKCQAVIGVQIQFGEISGGGKGQMFYAAAQGTPVMMEQVARPSN